MINLHLKMNSIRYRPFLSTTSLAIQIAVFLLRLSFELGVILLLFIFLFFFLLAGSITSWQQDSYAVCTVAVDDDLSDDCSSHPQTFERYRPILTLLVLISTIQGCSSMRQGLARRFGSFSRLYSSPYQHQVNLSMKKKKKKKKKHTSTQ